LKDFAISYVVGLNYYVEFYVAWVKFFFC
jgi:hypothetical protein